MKKEREKQRVNSEHGNESPHERPAKRNRGVLTPRSAVFHPDRKTDIPPRRIGWVYGRKEGGGDKGRRGEGVLWDGGGCVLWKEEGRGSTGGSGDLQEGKEGKGGRVYGKEGRLVLREGGREEEWPVGGGEEGSLCV